MTSRCRIIIAMLLSLLFNQVVAGVGHAHGFDDSVQHGQQGVAYSSATDEHCDSFDLASVFCCCSMISECGSNLLFATGPMLGSVYSDTWITSDFPITYDYSPDIEPRPPRRV